MEYDFLAHLRIDLSEFFQGSRPWSQFLRLAYQLPDQSHFKLAWHSDPEAAREYIRQHPEVLETRPRKASENRIPMDQWSPEVSILVSLLNEIKTLNANYVSVSSQGKKKPKPEYVQGPKTALDREIEKARIDRLAVLRAALTPRSQRKGD